MPKHKHYTYVVKFSSHLRAIKLRMFIDKDRAIHYAKTATKPKFSRNVEVYHIGTREVYYTANWSVL